MKSPSSGAEKIYLSTKGKTEMLSIGGLSGGKELYYLELAQEDYYINGGEPPGKWLGKGAEKLGLFGQINKEEFRHCFNGFSPDGTTKLIESAGIKTEKWSHRPGWDATFSAPKSVSILLASSSQDVQQEIRQAHLEAVKKALAFLEEHAVVARGKGGQTYEAAHLVIGAFEHLTSRAQDCQLHTHALILNIGVTKDGKTRALESKIFFQLKMAAGALYRAELAQQLQNRLGIELVKKRTWFEVKGVPDTLIEAFSTRRKEILEALKQRGLLSENGQVLSAKAAATAAVETRQKKSHLPRKELYKIWQTVCDEHGFKSYKLLYRFEKVLKAETERDNLVTSTIKNLTTWNPEDRDHKSLLSKNSFFSEQALIRAVAEELQTTGVGAERIINGVKDFLSSERVVRLERNVFRQKKPEKEVVYTTKEMLSIEKNMLAAVDLMQHNNAHQVKESTVTKVVRKLEVDGKQLSHDQEVALRHMTERSGSIQIIAGRAGAGKSFTLGAARSAWEQEGYQVIGTAVAAKAANGLQDSGFKSTMSIEKLLYEIDKSKTARQIKNTLTKPFKKIVKPLVKHSPLKLNERTVIVVDEAGMVGTRQMIRLIEEAQRSRAKLVLVGDWDQLQPIESGGPFRYFAQRLGFAELTTNFRQKEEWAKKAVLHFSKGQAKQALVEYKKRGLLTVAQSRNKAMQKLIADWEQQGGAKKPKEHLIIAGTNQEATSLNREAQRSRLQASYLPLKGYLKANSEKFYVGDRIMFTKNSREYGVENGTLGIVKKLNPFTHELTAKLDNGKVVTLNLKRYNAIKLGYAITTHKGQGITVKKNAYVLAGGAMQNLHMTYVQASRAKEKTRFYLDKASAGPELRQLEKQMQQEQNKELALSLTQKTHHQGASYQKEQQRSHQR
ncbi:MAG: relaxase domain-containing protein [Symploca sp. SIO2C1]|nr:relaxase domain-containing protein [Symploca sp. SIO2C1]